MTTSVAFDSQRVERGEPCPNCGELVRKIDVTSLPRRAVMAELYEFCVMDADEVENPYWDRTVVIYHAESQP